MSASLPDLDSHPAICADNIRFYVSDRLKAGTINLYSAYLLMHEALRLGRRCYTQPAWKHTLGITGLLQIYYDYLTGTALGCQGEASEAAEWFISDLALLHERRPHFLVNRLSQGTALLEDKSFFALLSNLRRDRECLSDDDGPFPTEVFPYDYASPERELLTPGSEAPFHGIHDLDSESSDLYVQLQINA